MRRVRPVSAARVRTGVAHFGRRVGGAAEPERPAGAPAPASLPNSQSAEKLSQSPDWVPVAFPNGKPQFLGPRRGLGGSWNHFRVVPAVFGGRLRTSPRLTAVDIVLHFLGGTWTLAVGGRPVSSLQPQIRGPFSQTLRAASGRSAAFCSGTCELIPGGFLHGVCGRGGAVVCPPLAMRLWASYSTPRGPWSPRS